MIASPRIRYLLSALIVQALLPTYLWAQTVQTVTGMAFVTNAAGVRSPLQVGSTLVPGSKLSTSGNDEVELSLPAGQALKLSGESSVGLEQVQFDPANPKGSALTLAVEQGAVRMVGSAAASSGQTTVRFDGGASFANISGSNGVDFTLVVDAAGNRVLVVTRGEASLVTPLGTVANVGLGQAVRWQPNAAPTVGPASSLPAALLAQVNAMQKGFSSPAVQSLLASLPPTGAGPQPPAIPPPAAAAASGAGSGGGGGGGCVGSPC